MRIPYSDAGVQTARGDADSVERDGVDLAEVTLKGADQLAGGYAPDLRGGIVAPRDDEIAMNFQASDAGLMAHQNGSRGTRRDVPDAQRSVP